MKLSSAAPAQIEAENDKTIAGDGMDDEAAPSEAKEQDHRRRLRRFRQAKTTRADHCTDKRSCPQKAAREIEKQDNDEQRGEIGFEWF